MTTHFELQPAESELQILAEQSWRAACERDHRLETGAFEAGAAIRNGEYTLSNLEAIVRWKSEQLAGYLVANGTLRIRRALEIAANPESTTEQAIRALASLHGIDVPMASSVLTAIFPERYIELKFEDLEALGLARQDIRFYEEYLAFCRGLVSRGLIEPQSNLPGPTPLRALDRALSQWSRSRGV